MFRNQVLALFLKHKILPSKVSFALCNGEMQCCQVFESPKDQNFFPKRPEKTKNVKNVKIGVNQKESKFLAFNTGVYLGVMFSKMFRYILLVLYWKIDKKYLNFTLSRDK